MLEVSADDLEAVYATLEEYKDALQAAEQEITELSSALVELEEDRDIAVAAASRHSRDAEVEAEAEGKQQTESADTDYVDKAQVRIYYSRERVHDLARYVIIGLLTRSWRMRS